MLTLNRADFVKDHVFGLEPIVFSDGLAEWPAAERWSPNTLRSINGQRHVKVAVSRSGRWRYAPDGSPLDRRDQMVIPDVPFDEATDWILTSTSDSPRFYISQVSIGEHLPGLLADLRFPTIAKSELNLWFGSADTVTPLHYDDSANLFAQLWGTKTLTLFAPEEGERLYPYPSDCKMPHLSSVDFENPDFQSFPRFREATPLRVTLKPGQLLFLPPFWWHHVRSESISISVNQWSPPALAQYRGPRGWSVLASEFQRDRWERLRSDQELNRDGLLAAADAFSQIGSPASVFAVAAAFHAFQMDSTESSSLRERLDSLVPPALASEGQWAHSDEAASLVSEVRELAAR